MTIDKILALGQTAMELGLINALTVLSLFLSYSMLNVCDLSTDGCFTLGACVGAVVAISGHPWLALPAAMCAGVVSGFVTALLQTRMGVESLLADGRVDFIFPADYREGRGLDETVRNILRKVAIADALTAETDRQTKEIR